MKAGFSNALPRKILYRSAAVLLALIAASAFTGCDKKSAPKPKAMVVPVIAAVSSAKDVPVTVTAIGNAESMQTVQIKSMVNGQIKKVYFTEGQNVRKGQMLFLIDPRPFEAALAQAEATLARDSAQAKYWQEEQKRYGLLVKKDYVAKEQFDQVSSNAAAQDALVKADQANVENAKVQLAYCYIKSPLDGKTGSILIQGGNVVKANDVPILTIDKISPIYVSFSVNQQYLDQIKKYMSAGVLKVKAYPAGESAPEEGRLVFINNVVDTSTGTVLLKAEFPNKNGRLWPGQFLNVSLYLYTLKNAVVVPSSTVQTGQKGEYVFVISPDMAAQVRPVKTGISYKGYTVIQSGLSANEKVVTDGQSRLMPGVKVKIIPAATASGAVSGAANGAINKTAGAGR
ncbi:MAG: efflux RND transporter periplasmic adaptor subunit [Nitrospiraceae bacterium]|nr:efflux RND transporter periplasmic adaptor subunit [Nitrospiraceae bacterium]